MSLNAHKALQLFYTQTRSQLRLNDIIHRTEVVPEDWGSIKNTVVPMDTKFQIIRPSKELVMLVFSCAYAPNERRTGWYPINAVEVITISYDKAVELWSKYDEAAQWVAQLNNDSTRQNDTTADSARQRQLIRDTYLKAYLLMVPEPVSLLLDDLDNLEEDGPSLNLVWKFLHNFTNTTDPQVTFSVKKNTLKLDVLGSEVSTYRLRPDIENSLTFTFYEPK